MSTLAQTSLSILAALSNQTRWAIGASLFFIGIVVIFYHASPMHLTGILGRAVSKVKKAYRDALANGALDMSNIETTSEMLNTLELKASSIREVTLRLSRSPFSALCDIFNLRRTVTVVHCILEVRALTTSIEILNESRFRDTTSPSTLLRRTISLRQLDDRV
ncbi:hypothetical protein K438DRAFT_1953626 [Mycena galopus ATCC 62051]|nr:hypothetical protein K438DRAFT_1953626 [Mycena galopus ATCC 62051]